MLLSFKKIYNIYICIYIYLLYIYIYIYRLKKYVVSFHTLVHNYKIIIIVRLYHNCLCIMHDLECL